MMYYTCLCPVLNTMDEEARRLVAINQENKVCVGRLECPLHYQLIEVIEDYHPGYGVDWSIGDLE